MAIRSWRISKGRPRPSAARSAVLLGRGEAPSVLTLRQMHVLRNSIMIDVTPGRALVADV